MSSVVFHVDLVQDVAILRPLIILAKSLPGRDIEVMVSSQFFELDNTKLWSGELQQLCADLEIPLTRYSSERDAFDRLNKRSGILIAGSESDVPNHAVTHRLFKTVPKSFVTVALQHGFECVGFLHNEAHNRRLGHHIRFAADVIVGWFDAARLTAVSARERSKLYIAGPPFLVDAQRSQPRPQTAAESRHGRFSGMVCENLHSVRFASQSMRNDFLEQFEVLARRLAAIGGELHLRPHPAGRFTERKGIALPAGVKQSTGPLYKIDLSRLSFGISAPSSILFDFVVAGIPAGVWLSPDGGIDAANFRGLHTVSSAEDWWNFAVLSTVCRDDILTAQQRFVESLEIPNDVRSRYARLMTAA